MHSGYPFTVVGTSNAFEATSPGEMLWLALRDRYMCPSGPAERVAELGAWTSWLDPYNALAQYHIDLAVSTGVHRLLEAGRRIVKSAGLEGNALREPEGRLNFETELRQYMVLHMGFSYLDVGAKRLVPPYAHAAILEGRAEISSQTRDFVYRESRADSGVDSIMCYSCGDTLWSPMAGRVPRDIALDHIWPRSLGGISTPENLLPICDPCNGAKEDRMSWSIFGVLPDYALAGRGGARLLGLALHRCAAGRLAAQSGLTLKQAFVRLGPQSPLTAIDPEAGSAFFNQTAHDITKLNMLW